MDNFLSLLAFALLCGFTNTVDYVKVTIPSLLDFFVDDFLGLVEELPAFVVANHNMANSVVHEVVSAHLAGKGTFTRLGAVLSSNLNRVLQNCLHKRQVKHTRQDHKVEVFRVVLNIIE